MQKKENRLSHVLLIYRKMIPSIRLCGHCQMEYLAQEGRIEYRAVQEMKLKTSDLNWADIVLLGRLDSWYEYQITRKLRKAGKTLIYIIDDDLLNIPPEISSAAFKSPEPRLTPAARPSGKLWIAMAATNSSSLSAWRL